MEYAERIMRKKRSLQEASLGEARDSVETVAVWWREGVALRRGLSRIGVGKVVSAHRPQWQLDERLPTMEEDDETGKAHARRCRDDLAADVKAIAVASCKRASQTRNQVYRTIATYI
jgi:hypothetical protein